jgi:hypothetical protein
MDEGVLAKIFSWCIVLNGPASVPQLALVCRRWKGVLEKFRVEIWRPYVMRKDELPVWVRQHFFDYIPQKLSTRELMECILNQMLIVHVGNAWIFLSHTNIKRRMQEDYMQWFEHEVEFTRENDFHSQHAACGLKTNYYFASGVVEYVYGVVDLLQNETWDMPVYRRGPDWSGFMGITFSIDKEGDAHMYQFPFGAGMDGTGKKRRKIVVDE